MKRGNILRWPDLVLIAVGVWLGFSPWLLGFFDDVPAATWNALVSGAVVIVVATFDIEAPAHREQWFLGGIGAWLVLSPLALNYLHERIAAGATIATGLGVTAVAAFALLAVRRTRRRPPR